MKLSTMYFIAAFVVLLLWIQAIFFIDDDGSRWAFIFIDSALTSYSLGTGIILRKRGF